VREWCFMNAIEALLVRGRGVFSFLPLAHRRMLPLSAPLPAMAGTS
jgi:hypothetical protein